MDDLLTRLQDLPAPAIYLVAALVVAAETAVVFGLLMPGEATLLTVGFLAYAGTLRLGPTVAVMIAAALAELCEATEHAAREGSADLAPMIERMRAETDVLLAALTAWDRTLSGASARESERR